MGSRKLGDKGKNMKSKHRLRKDDPVYYKCALKELITGAQDNGILLQGFVDGNNIHILFKSGNGECAGVVIPFVN